MRAPVEVTTYLHVGQDRRQTWSFAGLIRKHSNTKPDEAEPGCVVVKVKLRIPREAFEPLQPSAVIDVPLELVQRPVEVVAEDAS